MSDYLDPQEEKRFSLDEFINQLSAIPGEARSDLAGLGVLAGMGAMGGIAVGKMFFDGSDINKFEKATEAGDAKALAVAKDYGLAMDKATLDAIATTDALALARKDSTGAEALKVAKEHGFTLDQPTLKTIVAARNNTIAEELAGHNPAVDMAVGAVALPLFAAIALKALPASWVSRKDAEKRKAQASQAL